MEGKEKCVVQRHALKTVVEQNECNAEPNSANVSNDKVAPESIPEKRDFVSSCTNGNGTRSEMNTDCNVESKKRQKVEATFSSSIHQVAPQFVT